MPVSDPTLIHETWGNHTALLVRRDQQSNKTVGKVALQRVTVATAENPLQLELGGQLTHVEVGYETYGTLNDAGDNAILICHALTGSAHVAGYHEEGQVPGWWDPLIGPGKPIDTDQYFVICTNVLGGCYGTTGPSSVRPETGERYGLDFPEYTIRDMVHTQKRTIDALGVTKLRAVIGGSMGGMQVLEWAVLYPEVVDAIVPIAIGARHSAWAIGLSEVARRAIMSDPVWNNGNYAAGTQPETGLGLARAIAMLTYRSYNSFEQKFGRDRKPESRSLLESTFEISSYLAYHGVKLVERFDANTYLFLTKAMDEYDLAAGRGTLREVLGDIAARALVMGIDSDVLYVEGEAKYLAEHLPNATYATIRSPHGHDAFLIEYSQLAVRIREFLQAG